MSDPLFIDELQLYVGRDYKVNDYIKIHIPRVGEIVDYGEREYYQMVYCVYRKFEETHKEVTISSIAKWRIINQRVIISDYPLIRNKRK